MALSREKIIGAAMNMADAVGVEKLSMRKLAVPLKVEAMALYRHFKNKRELLDAMVAKVFTTINWQPDEEQIQKGEVMEQLRSRCHALRAMLLRHPWCLRLMDSQTDPGDAILTHHEQVLVVMRGGGFSRRLAADAYALMDSYVYGFVLQELQLPATEGVEFEVLAEAFLAKVPADKFPHLRDMTEHYFLKPGYSFSAGFDRGLDDILNQIAQRHADDPQGETL